MGGAKRGHVMPLEWLVGTPKICLSRPPQRALWEAKGCSECIVGKPYLIRSISGFSVIRAQSLYRGIKGSSELSNFV